MGWKWVGKRRGVRAGRNSRPLLRAEMAHGNGIAATLNGEKLVANGRWVLGVLIDGAVQDLPKLPAVTAEVDLVSPVDG